jgi:hypothetical protein
MKSTRSHRLFVITSTYIATKLFNYVQVNVEKRHAQDEFTNSDSSKRERLVELLSEEKAEI